MNPQQNSSPDNSADAAPSQPQVFGPQQTQPAAPPATPAQPEAFGPQQPQRTEVPVQTPPGPQVQSAPMNPQPVSTSSQPQVFGPQQTQSAFPTPASTPNNVVSGGQPPITPGLMSATPQAGTPQPLEATKKRRPGKKLIAIVAAVMVLGLGGSAFAYVAIMNNSPEKVLADALANTMTDVLDKKPYQLASTMKFESKKAGNPYSVSIDIDAKQVGENGEVGATVHLEAGEQMDLSVTGSIITEGTDAVYIKLDNLQKTVNDVVGMSPDIAPMANKVKPLIQKIDGRWIKIDEKSLASYGLVESEQKVDACTEEAKKLRISKADKKRVKEIFINNQFAIASEELPGETVDGDKSFHYKLDLNEEAGLKFVKEFVELESFAGVKKACDIKQESIDKDLKKLQEQKDEEVAEKPVLELWVSEKTRYPTKVKVTFDDKEFTMEQITTVKIDAQNIAVDIPKDFMTLEELQAEIEKTLSAASGAGMTQGWSSWRR